MKQFRNLVQNLIKYSYTLFLAEQWEFVKNNVVLTNEIESDNYP